MKSKLSILAAFAIVAIIAIFTVKGIAVHTPRQIPSTSIPTSNQWIETFSDNFDGTTLDNSKWVTCYDWRQINDSGCTNGGNFEQQWYLPEQVSVANGSAVLTAVHAPITVTTAANHTPTTYPYRSGMISTGRPDTQSPVKWSGVYGYYEARMKFDGGQGVWPAFWLLPADRNWPPEIDIMEFLGHNVNHVLLTSHWKGANGQPQLDSSTVAGPDFTNGWHTYAVNWQPGRIDWYIDGVLKKTVTGPQVPNRPMEIILNLAIGGVLPGNADATTPFPRSMAIDYVKVYELKH